MKRFDHYYGKVEKASVIIINRLELDSRLGQLIGIKIADYGYIPILDVQ